MVCCSCFCKLHIVCIILRRKSKHRPPNRQAYNKMSCIVCFHLGTKKKHDGSKWIEMDGRDSTASHHTSPQLLARGQGKTLLSLLYKRNFPTPLGSLHRKVSTTSYCHTPCYGKRCIVVEDFNTYKKEDCCCVCNYY